MPPVDTWNAERYTRHSSLQEAMAAQVLGWIDLRGDERVLDVGCGDGRISARIAVEKVPRGSVLGIDPSAAMIDHARRMHAGVANLSFEIGDARGLGIERRFDAAVSFNALHWVPAFETALRSLHDALLPSGRAWLRLVTRGSESSLEEAVEALRREELWAPRFEGFVDPYLRLDADEAAAAARDAGFVLVDLASRLEHWDFGSRAAFVGFCTAGLGAWTGWLPEGLHGRFVDEVIDSYAARPGSGGAAVFHFRQTDLLLQVP